MSKAIGYRLKAFELYNWGTFHERVFSIEPNGHDSLLTGDIGSGKSTIVDALTLLLVAKPLNQIILNKAAGADAKERSLRSYVLGEYKNDVDAESQRAKAVWLRDHQNYSVLLGRFHNVEANHSVYLAQVFWFREKAGQPERLFVVSEQDLTIVDDFTDFGDVHRLRLRLRKKGARICEGLKDYAAQFRRLMGISSDRALDLFYQTLSMKAVSDLTHFVREHMLDNEDVGERVDTLCKSFDDLDRAHQAVIKARNQINMLKPLMGNGQDYVAKNAEVDSLRSLRETLSLWKAGVGLRLEEIREEGLQRSLVKLGQKIDVRLAESDQLRAEEDGLRQAIAANGGLRLEEISREKKRLEQEIQERSKKRGLYEERLAKIGVAIPLSIDDFAQCLLTFSEQDSNLRCQEGETQNKHTDTEVAFRQTQAGIDAIEVELAALEGRPSNIPAQLLRLRRQMSEATAIPESRLPFVGELIQVRDKEQAWEGAIERVLHNFALSLLVEECHYKQVSQWVDQTHLRGRLVYYRLVPLRRQVDLNQLHEASLVHKLRVKEETNAYDWLMAQLANRFDYACCETLDEFRRFPQAITSHGQTKSGGDRHEKDDRHALHDRSRFVLGWDNHAKIQALKQRLRDERQAAAIIKDELARLQASLAEIKDRAKVITQILEIKNFTEIDVTSLTAALAALQRQYELIEAASSRLRELNAELKSCEIRSKELRDAIWQLQEEKASVQEKINQSHMHQQDAKSVLATVDANALGVCLERTQILYDETFPNDPPHLNNLAARERGLREQLQGNIDALDKRLKLLSEKIVSAMAAYKLAYPAETIEVDTTLDALPDYGKMLKGLEEDGLPRFEERFKQELNEKTIQSIVHFQSQLERAKREIHDRIAQINVSLQNIDYNGGTYIELRVQPALDTDIRTFQQDLRACLDGSLAEQLYDESKFLRVKALIERFRGREGQLELDKRWTQKVTDVRHWFEFAAAEIWRNDGGIREFYESSSGKSGGQKEKLAYTVLASALAYQYGIDHDQMKTRSFRLVCIDEAFGRGSDESTRYGLELFNRLGLQLLIVTPLQKIGVIEDYVHAVHYVHNRGGKESNIRNIGIEEYRKEKQVWRATHNILAGLMADGGDRGDEHA